MPSSCILYEVKNWLRIFLGSQQVPGGACVRPRRPAADLASSCLYKEPPGPRERLITVCIWRAASLFFFSSSPDARAASRDEATVPAGSSCGHAHGAADTPHCGRHCKSAAMKVIITLTQENRRLRQRRRGGRTYARVPEPESVPWLPGAFVMTRGQLACMVHASVPSTHACMRVKIPTVTSKARHKSSSSPTS